MRRNYIVELRGETARDYDFERFKNMTLEQVKDKMRELFERHDSIKKKYSYYSIRELDADCYDYASGIIEDGAMKKLIK